MNKQVNHDDTVSCIINIFDVFTVAMFRVSVIKYLSNYYVYRLTMYCGMYLSPVLYSRGSF